MSPPRPAFGRRGRGVIAAEEEEETGSYVEEVCTHV